MGLLAGWTQRYLHKPGIGGEMKDLSDTDNRWVVDDAKRLIAEFHKTHSTGEYSDLVKWLAERIGAGPMARFHEPG